MKRIGLALCVLLCSCALSAYGQGPVTGFPPYGSFANGGFDQINLANLNVYFSISTISGPGRGGTSFSMPIANNSSVWETYLCYGASGYYPCFWEQAAANSLSGAFGWDWQTGLPVGGIFYNSWDSSYQCGTDYGNNPLYHYETDYSGYVYLDPAGTQHSIPRKVTDVTEDDCGGSTGWTDGVTGTTTDGSGYYINAASPGLFVRNASGVTVCWGGLLNGQSVFSALTDTNGSVISSTYVSSTEVDWKDTANHTILRVIQNWSNTEYHFHDSSGTIQVSVRSQSTPCMQPFGEAFHFHE